MKKRKSEFVKRLQAWRAAKGLSQSQAAAQLGVPVRTLQNWERVANVPHPLAQQFLMEKFKL